MEISNKLGGNALRRIGLLIVKASDLGMDLNCDGYMGENKMSGYAYLWAENYQFSLCIGLGSDDVIAFWNSSESDWEEFTDTTNKTLYDLEQWASDCVKTEQSYNEEMGA